MVTSTSLKDEKEKNKLAASVDLITNLAGLRHPLAAPVLFYFMAILLPVAFYVGPIQITGVRLVLLLLVIPLTVRLFIGEFGRIIVPDIAFFVYVLWIFVPLFIHNPTRALESGGSSGLEFWGGYLLGRAYIRSREDFIAIIRLIAFVVICCVPFAVYETISGNTPILDFLNLMPGVTSLHRADTDIRLGFHRVQLIFEHPIHFGLFCAIMLPMCWIGMKGIYRDTTRFVICAAVLVSGFSSLSSGGIVAMFIQLGLIGWAWLFRSTSRRWIYLAVLILIAYLIISVFSSRNPLAVFISYGTFSSHNAYVRIAIFEHGLNNVLSSPWFGIGLNNWVRPAWIGESVDNFWLLTSMRYGIPGVALLAIGYVYALVRIGLRNLDQDVVMWQFRRAWLFSFSGLSFTLATVHIWHNIYSFVFFMFGTGMWLLTEKPQKGDVETQTKEILTRKRYKTFRVYDKPTKGMEIGKGEPAYTRAHNDEGMDVRKVTSKAGMKKLPTSRGMKADSSKTKLLYTRFSKEPDTAQDIIKKGRKKTDGQNSKAVHYTRRSTKHTQKSNKDKDNQ